MDKNVLSLTFTAQMFINFQGFWDIHSVYKLVLSFLILIRM